MRKYWLIFKLIIELLILRLALREAFDDAPIFRRIKRRIKRRWFSSNIALDLDLAMRTKLADLERPTSSMYEFEGGYGSPGGGYGSAGHVGGSSYGGSSAGDINGVNGGVNGNRVGERTGSNGSSHGSNSANTGLDAGGIVRSVNPYGPASARLLNEMDEEELTERETELLLMRQKLDADTGGNNGIGGVKNQKTAGLYSALEAERIKIQNKKLELKGGGRRGVRGADLSMEPPDFGEL